MVAPHPVWDHFPQNALRVEELRNGHVRKLHIFVAVDPVRGDKIMAHDEYIPLWGLGMPNRFVLGRRAGVVVDGEDFRQFVDEKRTGADSEKLDHAMGVLPILVRDALHHSTISYIIGRLRPV